MAPVEHADTSGGDGGRSRDRSRVASRLERRRRSITSACRGAAMDRSKAANCSSSLRRSWNSSDSGATRAAGHAANPLRMCSSARTDRSADSPAPHAMLRRKSEGTQKPDGIGSKRGRGHSLRPDRRRQRDGAIGASGGSRGDPPLPAVASAAGREGGAAAAPPGFFPLGPKARGVAFEVGKYETA